MSDIKIEEGREKLKEKERGYVREMDRNQRENMSFFNKVSKGLGLRLLYSSETAHQFSTKFQKDLHKI